MDTVVASQMNRAGKLAQRPLLLAAYDTGPAMLLEEPQ